MTRAVGPRVGLPPEAVMPLALTGLAWVPAILAGLVWAAGHLASKLAGQGWSGPEFNIHFGFELVKQGPAQFWPGIPTGQIMGIAGGMLALIVIPATVIYAKWSTGRTMPGDPLPSLGTPFDMTSVGPKAIAEKAKELRPTLSKWSAKQLLERPDETGLPLGSLKGGVVPVRASWEDVVLVFMAPRSGKTTQLAVPHLLAAPGAVVATSNKPDLWALTAEPRRRQTNEHVWVFDPHGITYPEEQSWWWNPLRGVDKVEHARRLAGHFIAQIKDQGKTDFWSQAAHDVLSSLFLAAGTTVDTDDERTLDDVYDWLNDPDNPVPINLLHAQGHTKAARALAGRNNGAPETRDGIYETARTAASCLGDPEIMSWVTPPKIFPRIEFETAEFARTRQTLYLLSKEDEGGAAPLVAAFADKVMLHATKIAERMGDRLDPPMVVVLDEAANICRIENLPKLYSHFGSRGIIPVTILQSYPQGVGVWGQTGMETLWSASTVKIIGPGMDDDRFLESLSTLIGEHDVTTRSVSQGKGSYGENLSLRRQRILSVSDLRGLPKGTTILLASGLKPAMLSMHPWYEGPRKKEIATAFAQARADIRVRSGVDIGGEAGVA